MMRRLPVRLSPAADELLSSWINRHAAFYVVPPLVMLRHCLPDARSLRTADLHLTDTQVDHLASIFATEPDVVRGMTFTNVPQSARRLIAARPLQFCPNCLSGHEDPRAILRSQLSGWRVTCPFCGGRSKSVPSTTISPPLFANIATRLCGAKSCSTMKPNAASEPGHHHPISPAFS
jgi:hypothetical protein